MLARRAGGLRRLRSRPSGGGLKVETVATGLEVPWEIAFLPDGRALVTERPGRVRLLDADGKLRREPVATVDVSAQGEGGLLGLALDPEFAANHFVYLYFTTADGMKLERWRFADGRLEREAGPDRRRSRPGRCTTPGGSRSGPTATSTSPPARPGNGELAQDTGRSTASSCA